jgi:hypothetical protein
MIGVTFLCFLACPQQSVADLIRLLDDDRIEVRRKAADELLLRGPGIEEALWVVVLRGDSLEARLVAKDILRRLDRLFGLWSSPGSASPRIPLETVTDQRLFGRLKDDPPMVEER